MGGVSVLARVPRSPGDSSAVRLPLLGGLGWLDVVDAAGGLCECAGWCGHPRCLRRRCAIPNLLGAPLHVVAPPSAGGAVAVCRGCHDRWAATSLTDPACLAREGR